MSLKASKQLYALCRTAQWRNANTLCSLQYESHIWRWLNDNQSLTQRLIDVSKGHFCVQLLSQKNAIPLWHEQDSLRQPHHLAAAIREVSLDIFDHPVVLARSVIPMSLIQQHQNGLTKLGRQPLGQLLFKEGRVRVSRRQFTKIGHGAEAIYGRRTPYEYLGSTILVCEFYLPRISKFQFE